MRYLGLDLGSKTLGISMSDPTLTLASIYKTIYFANEDYQSLISPLKEIVTENNISKIILGFPKNMNNTIGPRAEITLEFKKMLENNLPIEVVMNDERLTSVISHNVMLEANMSRQKRKKKVDGIAAQIILQSYLDKERNEKND